MIVSSPMSVSHASFSVDSSIWPPAPLRFCSIPGAYLNSSQTEKARNKIAADIRAGMNRYDSQERAIPPFGRLKSAYLFFALRHEETGQWGNALYRLLPM